MGRSLSQIYVRPDSAQKSAPKKRIAFGWYGGKYSHLNWLLPLLPECHHRVLRDLNDDEHKQLSKVQQKELFAIVESTKADVVVAIR